MFIFDILPTVIIYNLNEANYILMQIIFIEIMFFFFNFQFIILISDLIGQEIKKEMEIIKYKIPTIQLIKYANK